MDDPDWYPPMLDYNLPEDNEYIINLTFEIRAMMLEMDRYKNNSSLTNEQKRSKIREGEERRKGVRTIRKTCSGCIFGISLENSWQLS